MLPSRCPHCQAELPKLGRFCVMCGRRVEGWRGLMPTGDPERGEAEKTDKTGSAFEPDGSDAPREVNSQEEKTRPVLPEVNLAAAAATAYDDDYESRKPTGEVPSIGHELRARAPNQRVHTSPIGNILPNDVLEALDEAVAANSGRTRDSARSAAHRLASAGPAARPSGPHRTDRTPATPLRPPSRLTPEPVDPEDSGERSSRGSRSARSSGRRLGLRGRRTARNEFPLVAPPLPEPDDDDSAPAAITQPRRPLNAPLPIGAEPTHFIPRRPRRSRTLGFLRTLMWAVLWLGLGGVVAFSVVVLFRRHHHQPPPAPSVPPVPKAGPAAAPRRPSAAPKSAPVAPRPVVPSGAAPLPSPTQARDLVVPIPAGARPPIPPAPSAAVPGAPPAPGAAAPLAAAPEPPALPLDPKQRVAAEQTMSNIEFVVAERVAQVRACYDRVVRAAGADAPTGRVEVALTLTDEGLTQSVVTIGNTVGSPLLSGCLEQRIAEWHFPRPLGTARTFRLPFIFSPSPEQSGPRPRR